MLQQTTRATRSTGNTARQTIETIELCSRSYAESVQSERGRCRTVALIFFGALVFACTTLVASSAALAASANPIMVAYDPVPDPPPSPDIAVDSVNDVGIELTSYYEGADLVVVFWPVDSGYVEFACETTPGNWTISASTTSEKTTAVSNHSGFDVAETVGDSGVYAIGDPISYKVEALTLGGFTWYRLSGPTIASTSACTTPNLLMAMPESYVVAGIKIGTLNGDTEVTLVTDNDIDPSKLQDILDGL